LGYGGIRPSSRLAFGDILNTEVMGKVGKKVAGLTLKRGN